MSLDPRPGGGAMAHPVAERLDSLMVVLLAYIRDVCHVDGNQKEPLAAG